jgi:hypothetical protein
MIESNLATQQRVPQNSYQSNCSDSLCQLPVSPAKPYMCPAAFAPDSTSTSSLLIRTHSGLSIQNGPDTLDWLDRSLASHSTCMNLRSRSEHGHEISSCDSAVRRRFRNTDFRPNNYDLRRTQHSADPHRPKRTAEDVGGCPGFS